MCTIEVESWYGKIQKKRRNDEYLRIKRKK